jgi:hypothetical protein
MFKSVAIISAFALSTVLASAQAFANGSDPRFSYEAAEAAYSSARTPSLDEVTSNSWRVVGVVSAIDTTQDGYWADGEMVLPNQIGHFHSDAFVSSQKDAFGNIILSWRELLVGSETGAVYYDQASSARLHPRAFAYTSLGSTNACETTSECRVVNSSVNLLCRMIVTDKRKACDAYPKDNVNRYRLFVPLAH